MAPVIRRRRFTIFILICCISLVIISWYSSKHSEKTVTNKVIIDILEDLITSNQVQDLNEKKFSIREEDSAHTTQNDFEIITKLGEVEKIEDYSIKYKFEPIYEYNVFYESEDSRDPDDKRIISLLKELAHLERKRTFSNESNETFARIRRNHPKLNDHYPIEKNASNDKFESTPYNGNYNIEKLENCKECKGDKNTTTINGTEFIKPTKNPSLIIDTPGCKIPKLDPWDPSVIDLIENRGPLICPGLPLFMTTGSNGSISLNENVLKGYYNMTAGELICKYQAIYREHEQDRPRENSFTLGNVTNLEFGVPLDEDYLAVFCKIKNKSTNFEQFFPLVHLKKEVEDEKNAKKPPNPKLNVILVGIDSVSKLNFLRHFKKTMSFLNEKVSSFEMNGYTKVGDNTFPNLVPMLTGRFVDYYWNETLKNTMYFDDIDLIWKDYAKKGYRTFYAEDHPMAGTFNYIKRGFYDPPTDYYYRPLALALDSLSFANNKDKYCVNSQIETDIIYDYLRDFIKAMKHRPYFSFAMTSTLTHDVFNQAVWADVPAANLLEDLSNLGALNSSLLVLFSDHGIRFGRIRYTYIGKYEERMPFMYIHAPKWFLDQYPEIAKNLKTNQDRLMTLFDIHATMVHLLDLNKTHEERSTVTIGTSLFDEIPEDRTCDDAHIKQHWCPCAEFEDIPLNSSEALNASEAIVNYINSQLKTYGNICEVLEVDDIMSAMMGKANEIVLRYVRAENEELNKKIILGNKVEPIADYMITIATKPGSAVFEATVRHEPVSDSYTVFDISRLTLYGNTSWCIDSQRLKLFCYCKVQKEP